MVGGTGFASSVTEIMETVKIKYQQLKMLLQPLKATHLN